MPLVEITYSNAVTSERLNLLARTLPHAVSLAVACEEEPYDHDLQPGDVEVRFRPLGPYDVSAMDLVIEVRSKWFMSRQVDRQRRCERLRDLLLAEIGPAQLGVYLTLPVAGWSQTA